MAGYKLNTEDQPFYHLSRFFIFVGIVLISGLVFTLMGLAIAVSMYDMSLGNGSLIESMNDSPEAVNGLKLIQTFTAIGFFIIPALIFPRIVRKRTLPYTGLSRGFAAASIVFIVLLIFSQAPLITWMVNFNKSWNLPEYFHQMEAEAAELTKLFLQLNSPSDIFINLFVIALLPAFSEELLFRGVLQRFMHSWTNNIHVAIIITAVLFSSFHMQFLGFLPRMFMGVILGYLFYWTGSLWAPILAHFINNGMAVIVSAYHLDENQYEFLKDNYSFPWYVVVLSAVLVGVCLYFVKRQNDGPKEENSDVEVDPYFQL